MVDHELPAIGTVWAWQNPSGKWIQFTIKAYHESHDPFSRVIQMNHVETEEGDVGLVPWLFTSWLKDFIADGRIIPAHLAP